MNENFVFLQIQIPITHYRSFFKKFKYIIYITICNHMLQWYCNLLKMFQQYIESSKKLISITYYKYIIQYITIFVFENQNHSIYLYVILQNPKSFIDISSLPQCNTHVVPSFEASFFCQHPLIEFFFTFSKILTHNLINKYTNFSLVSFGPKKCL
jgi:hypothetical protein